MLLVGLGNPGARYARNRHNVGFMAVEDVLHRYSFPAWREKFKGFYSAADIAGQRVHLLLPQTFMNNSGESVRAAADFFKIAPAEVVVVYDELDLPPGQAKFKTGGGHAGHNGVRSIIQHLGTPDFQRIRIGIGHPGRKELVTPYVLGDFAADEQPLMTTACTRVSQALPVLMAHDVAAIGQYLAGQRD